jgi:thiamine kinase-like enzyme
MRVPGEGTDKLINRKQEAAVYETISGLGLCDDPVYIDPETGYKITRYLEGVRVCDPDSEEDLAKCMTKLRHFHSMGLKVEHEFDIFGQIAFYESLRGGRPSLYRDYREVRDRVYSLRPWIESMAGTKVLTHIDAVPDNFLFYKGEDGREHLQLTDWEYAGMQDPHVDIAMFCIYSMYDKAQTDRLIRLYFDREVPDVLRAKIYAYIAACGLLWSNWCEYKLILGVEFGEYSLRQYRYAKEYYRHTMNLIGQIEEN